MLITTLLCALTLAVGYANKARCIGPEFDSSGRSEPDYGIRVARDVCYSDMQQLWIGRDIDRHVFPYVNGGYNKVTEQLYGGAVEYPVLTGLAIYLAAIPSSTDGDFLLFSAILLAVAGLLTAAVLAWLAGLRSWWFALAPPLVLYAFHNWDLFAVCATVVAFAILLRAGRALGNRGDRPALAAGGRGHRARRGCGIQDLSDDVRAADGAVAGSAAVGGRRGVSATGPGSGGWLPRRSRPAPRWSSR